MSRNSKRTIAVIALLLIAALFWYFFFSKPKAAPVTGGAQQSLPVQAGESTKKSNPATKALGTTARTGTATSTGQSVFAGDPSGGQGNISSAATAKIGQGLPVLGMDSKPIRVTGSIAFDKQGRPFSRFIEKGTGNAFEADLFSGKSRRLTITTIPLIAESPFVSDGSLSFLISEKDGGVSVSFASIPSPSATSSLPSQGSQIALLGSLDGITAFAPYPLPIVPTGTPKQKAQADIAQAFVIQDASDGGADGFIISIPSLKKKLVWHSPLREWNASWVSDSLITLTTKPSYQAPGLLYFLNPKNSSSVSPENAGSLVLGPKNGLTALVSPDGTKIAYSESTDLGISSALLDIKSGTETPFSSGTVPADKCTWSADSSSLFCGIPGFAADGNYPDAWYQGLDSFSDDIWQIDATTVKTTLISEGNKLSDAGIDTVDLHLSPHGDFLLFTNKKDSILWSVRVK